MDRLEELKQKSRELSMQHQQMDDELEAKQAQDRALARQEEEIDQQMADLMRKVIAEDENQVALEALYKAKEEELANYLELETSLKSRENALKSQIQEKEAELQSLEEAIEAEKKALEAQKQKRKEYSFFRQALVVAVSTVVVLVVLWVGEWLFGEVSRLWSNFLWPLLNVIGWFVVGIYKGITSMF